jgi:hypothetical protein
MKPYLLVSPLNFLVGFVPLLFHSSKLPLGNLKKFFKKMPLLGIFLQNGKARRGFRGRENSLKLRKESSLKDTASPVSAK